MLFGVDLVKTFCKWLIYNAKFLKIIIMVFIVVSNFVFPLFFSYFCSQCSKLYANGHS